MTDASYLPAAVERAGAAPRRLLAVINPKAGSCTAEDVRAALNRQLPAAGWQPTMVEIDAAPIPYLVRQALDDGCDLVVAAGGDGTVSEVAQALVGTQTPLGILPVGTANVLARDLGIPLDLEGACALLAGQHAVAAIDALRVGERYAIVSIGIGIYSEVVKATDSATKKRFGRLAYGWTLLRRLAGYQSHRFTIVADGQRRRSRALLVLVANTPSVGLEPFRWGEHIAPDDGIADVCVVTARTLRAYVALAVRALFRRQAEDPNVSYLRARRVIDIATRHPLPLQVDGEIIGATPTRIEVVPAALRVVVPSARRAGDASPFRNDARPVSHMNDNRQQHEQAAAPAGEALREAVKQIETPEQAERVARALAAAASGVRAEDALPAAPEPPAEAVAAVEASVPGSAKAPATVLAAAQEVAATPPGEAREALETALQAAINPELRGERDPELAGSRDMLREALLRQLGPYQAIDTRLFLAVNHLPHTPATNALMGAVTRVMTGGFGYVAGEVLAVLTDPRPNGRDLAEFLAALWFATLIVEYPVKYYFRRKRPFIDIVQAITVGRKPGTFSFPSGHSASAFAGALLLTHRYPWGAPLWYAIAALTGFSRVYLGAHYPGDVASGALLGTLLAEAARQAIKSYARAVQRNR